MIKTGHIARALLSLTIAAALPASVIWWPVADLPGLGQLTAGDLTLAFAWCLTLPLVFSRRTNKLQRIAGAILVAVVSPGLLACFGAYLYSADSPLLLEFGMYMKRFGLAAILPLSA